jgi:hypothetical protein
MIIARIYKFRRGWLLPLTLLAAVLFISAGIVFPTMHHPGSPGLSAQHKAKPSSTAVVKAQTKSPQLRVVKTAQPLDLCKVVALCSSRPFYRTIVRCEPLFIRANCTATIPARAPPA